LSSRWTGRAFVFSPDEGACRAVSFFLYVVGAMLVKSDLNDLNMGTSAAPIL
jgi:hypothetical protein